LYQLSPEIIFSSKTKGKKYENDFLDIFGCEMRPSSVWWLYGKDKTIKEHMCTYKNTKKHVCTLNKSEDEGGLEKEYIYSNLERKLEESEGFEMELGKEVILKGENKIDIKKIKQSRNIPFLEIPHVTPAIHTVLFRFLGSTSREPEYIIEWMSRLSKPDYFTILLSYSESLKSIKKYFSESTTHSSSPIDFDKDIQNNLLNELEKVWRETDKIKKEILKKNIKKEFNHSFLEPIDDKSSSVSPQDFNEVKETFKDKEKIVEILEIAINEIESKLLEKSKKRWFLSD